MSLTDTIQSIGKTVVDTAATVYVAKNTKPAPTDTPKVAAPPAGLPPTQPAAGTAATVAVPRWVWIAGAAVAVVGAAVFFLKRK